MKRFRKRLQHKLKSKKGETLSEVLIATLVSTLGITLLASMISHSVEIIQRSKVNFKAYVEEENRLVDHTNKQNGVVMISSSGVAFVLAEELRTGVVPVEYFTNNADTDSAKIVYAYKAK